MSGDDGSFLERRRRRKHLTNGPLLFLPRLTSSHSYCRTSAACCRIAVSSWICFVFFSSFTLPWLDDLADLQKNLVVIFTCAASTIDDSSILKDDNANFFA